MKQKIIPLIALSALGSPLLAADLTATEGLGKALFFDADLSFNGNQACAFCHEPAQGFSSPHAEFNAGGAVVEGSIQGRFGNRKPPTASYASQAPVFHHTIEDGGVLYVGGAFLDGRATGHVLGNVAADQAMGPFTNPAEMAMPHSACVVQKVCASDYAGDMAAVWGADICSISFPDDLAANCAIADADISIDDEAVAGAIEGAFFAIARSIAAYEGSAEVSPFNSRFDQWQRGETNLTDIEMAGFELFEGDALCAECHVLDTGPNNEPALFTDFTYDNLGVPRNRENPFYAQADNADGADYIDLGLAGFLASDPIYDILAGTADGKQKVPTLRNVDARVTPDTPKAFMHNGYFKTLAGVVKFYNTRDVLPACENALATEAEALAANCWPAPEVASNVNGDELGDLKLTDADEAALVAFLGTLTDG